MAKTIEITELDFEEIKTSIINYMSSKKEFKDYDFQASGLNTLIDILATNTHINSYYMNAISNEMFLDTARIRDNVVSKAKMLNYTPRSKKAAEMVVNLEFQGTVPKSSSNVYETFMLNKDFEFTATKDGISYKFRPKNNVIVPKVSSLARSDGTFTNVFSVKDVVLIQGTYVTENYIVNTNDPNQRYLLTNSDVDTSTITVFVYDNPDFPEKQEFKRSNDNMKLSELERAFFLQEGRGGNYEIYFGDGVLGAQIESGQMIEINYLTTSGSAGNEIVKIDAKGKISNYEILDSIEVVSRSAGGADEEDIESIKFHAPKTFGGQGRAVTVNDYKTIIPQIYPSTQSLNIWGGEDNIPPTYGRVYISIRPDTGFFLSEYTKEEIRKKLRKDYSVLSIEPQIVDAEYTKLKINTTVQYDNETTSLSQSDIKNIVSNGIVSFSKKYLDDFNDYFRYSNFVNWIDTLDQSITNNETYVGLINEQTVLFNTSAFYVFNFNNKIKKGSIKSVGVRVVGDTRIYYVEETSNYDGKLKFYTFDVNDKKIYSTKITGSVNYETGTINIDPVNIEAVEGSLEVFRLECVPAGLDVFPRRNQVLVILKEDVTVTVEEDTDDYNNNYDITTQNVKTIRNN